MTRYCRANDRHEPSLECGYPLPCPYHTVVVAGVDRMVKILTTVERIVDVVDRVSALMPTRTKRRKRKPVKPSSPT